MAKERVNGQNINKNRNAGARKLIKELYSINKIYKCKIVDEFNSLKIKSNSRIKIEFKF